MTNLMDYAKEVMRSEAEAVISMCDRLGDEFNLAVEAILQCRGRVIVSGIGKSGLIGRKIVATLNSTGIASFFLHPAEAIHGDLGLMRSDDVLLLISKSGVMLDTEVVVLAARRLGVAIIGLSGTPGSELSQRADIVLDCSVRKEACPNNLVPTSSSTATLVMGDALALALLRARNFTSEDFAALHPGGTLGQRLLKRVSELHHIGDAIPLVNPESSMKQMILEMTGKRLGCVLMTDDQGQVIGIFTDGDLRRLIEKRGDFYALTAKEAMIRTPKTIPATAVLDAALAMMEKHSITQLATVDSQRRLVGVIHLHDILRSKLV